MRKSAIIGLSLLMILLGPSLVSAQAEEAAIYTITINHQVTNNGPTQAENVRMKIYLFDNISGWAEQTVINERFWGVTRWSTIERTTDNRLVEIFLGDIQPEESKTATITQTLKISAVDLSIDPNAVVGAFPQELLDNFTLPVPGLFESNHPAIRDLAQRLTENTTNPHYKARRIFDYLLENFKYERQQVEHGALWAIQMGKGDCTEFSNLFIALARATGVPAKAVSGYAYLPLYPSGISVNVENFAHAYSIFYLPTYGWVPADAVWPQHIGSFGKIDYTHIAGATTGGQGIVGADGRIKWPGPPDWKERAFNYVGQRPNVTISTNASIIPEVFVDVSLQASPQIQNDTLTLTVTVKNMGRNPADNVAAELDLDPAYFKVITPAQQKSSLASEEQWQTSFNVQLKGNAYGNRHTMTAKVTYDSSYGVGGTFLSKGESLVTIASKPAIPGQVYDVMLFALIGALVGAIAALGVVLARR